MLVQLVEVLLRAGLLSLLFLLGVALLFEDLLVSGGPLFQLGLMLLLLLKLLLSFLQQILDLFLGLLLLGLLRRGCFLLIHGCGFRLTCTREFLDLFVDTLLFASGNALVF